MPRPKRGRQLKNWKTNRSDPGLGKLRIIGGKFRGRLIDYSGDPVTRPMKDNVREALFNLVGGWVPGKAVVDLFAGTGAIGLEAVSRGATQAVLIERHFPTARIIENNVRSLGVDELVQVVASDTFFWGRQFAATADQRPTEPWMVFCCPPYQLFLDQTEDLLALLDQLIQLAPPTSLVVVESDERFDARRLPRAEAWEVRQYSPAQLAVLKLP